MRLIYLDEAGADTKMPVFCVAGVIVHGDIEWPEIDRRIDSLIEQYVPPEHRYEFVFHATDIFHGSGKVFDRRKPEWSDAAARCAVLNDLAKIIDDLSLPVVFGVYRREGFPQGLDGIPDTKHKEILLHNVSAVDCFIRADRWLEEFAPSEMATVIHEDRDDVKRFIRDTMRVCRNADSLYLYSVPPQLGLPLKRIIDTVNFAEKLDARPLQLADLCAFLIGRSLNGRPIPREAAGVVTKHSNWITKLFPLMPAAS